MFTPIAVALAAAFWLAYLVALAAEKHLFDHALRLWNSLSRPKKCVASVLFVCVVAYAGTKPLSGGGDDGGDDPTGTNVVEIVEGDATNLVENIGGEASTNLVENGEAQSGEGESGEAVSRPLLMGLPPPYTSGQESASPLLASSPAPLSLDAVGRGETTDFTAPEGAVVATNWLMHGVTTGRVCVSTSDWDFPFGTNILRSFAAFADGRLEPWPGGDGITLAPLVAPLGIVPEANWTLLAPTNRPSLFWWTMRGNALVCTWQNVLLGREIDCPVSFQAELRATGGVTYRYDLGRLASDDPLTNAVVFATDNSVPLCLCVEKSLTSLAFRSTDEVACDECAASLASAMGGADPFACPPNSTNTVLEHAYYSGTTNGAIHLPESSPALAVLRVTVSGTGSGELLVGGRAVPLRAPAPRLFASAPPASAPNSQPSSLLLSVPRGETLPVYLRGDSTLSLSLDSDDFAFGVLPDLSGRHCRGWINFPYTEASHPCIHSFMAHETDVTLPVGEGADDLTCTWNETDDVEVWNRPPRSARITGHFDPRYERPVTYTLSHPRYLFGQTEYEQNARYCPKPSDDDQTDYLGVGIPFPDECWCCHWQTCDTNCTCGCSHCGGWTVSPTNDYDFARTNYPHMGGVLKIRTPSEYSASVALSVPAGMRRCCPCPEHWTNGVSLVYARRVSVVGPSGSEFRSSVEPVTVRIAATEPSYEPGDGRALFATNGAFSLSCDYTCLGVGISAYDIDLPALNAKNRQFGLPVVVNTNLDEAVEIRLDVNVLLRGGRIRLSVEDASAPLEVWGYDYVRRERVKLADADTALDVTMAEWRRMTGHADDSGVPTTYVQLLVPRTGQATLVLHYWNVIDNKFVEDEARQVVTAINPPLRADMDHDGDVDEHDAEKLASGRPFWFWVNDDRIKGDYAGAIEGNSFNATDFKVNGKFDLVNLFPIVADASAFKAAWGDSVTYELRGSSGYLNFCVLRDIGADETYAMQTGTVYAVTGEPLESATLSALGSRGTNITYYVENSERSQVVFAFESKGSVYPSISPELLVKVSGRTVIRYRIPLSIYSVDGMYRFCNIRSAATNPPFVPTVPGQTVEWAEDGQSVDLFFTHGFNVSLEDARNWGRILFKRFWHSGFNARFHMLTWEGNHSILPGELFNALHYQHDVWYALRTGGALKRYIEAAQPDATKRVLMTQSLGNMVACEALKEGLHVSHYFMFDAALPGESIDEALQARSLESPAFVKYVPTDWQDYNYMSWAANWFRWFEDNANDARGGIGWPGYFTTALGNADNVYNYYSSGDDVFKEFSAVPSRLDGFDESKAMYCWQKQETLKGSAVLAGTAYAGWAFHHWTVHELVHDIGGGVHYEDKDYKYSAADAARMIANGSITNNPVFNSDFSPMFDSDASIDDQWLALGKYVPAVSSPVGGRAINTIVRENVDMNVDTSEGVPRPNEWGRASSDWQHSDMKDMGYFYVYKLYEQIIQKGHLK